MKRGDEDESSASYPLPLSSTSDEALQLPPHSVSSFRKLLSNFVEDAESNTVANPKQMPKDSGALLHKNETLDLSYLNGNRIESFQNNNSHKSQENPERQELPTVHRLVPQNGEVLLHTRNRPDDTTESVPRTTSFYKRQLQILTNIRHQSSAAHNGGSTLINQNLPDESNREEEKHRSSLGQGNDQYKSNADVGTSSPPLRKTTARGEKDLPRSTMKHCDCHDRKLLDFEINVSKQPEPHRCADDKRNVKTRRKISDRICRSRTRSATAAPCTQPIIVPCPHRPHNQPTHVCACVKTNDIVQYDQDSSCAEDRPRDGETKVGINVVPARKSDSDSEIYKAPHISFIKRVSSLQTHARNEAKEATSKSDSQENTNKFYRMRVAEQVEGLVPRKLVFDLVDKNIQGTDGVVGGGTAFTCSAFLGKGDGGQNGNARNGATAYPCVPNGYHHPAFSTIAKNADQALPPDGSNEELPPRYTSKRLEVYYFDHGNSAYYGVTDNPPAALTDELMERADDYSTKFWAEVFGILAVALSFVTSFVLQLLKFILASVIRPYTANVIQLVADYFVKPLLAVCFNGIIQPVLILLYNIAKSVRDLSEPLAQAFGFWIREISHAFRAIRFVEVNTGNTCQKIGTKQSI